MRDVGKPASNAMSEIRRSLSCASVSSAKAHCSRNSFTCSVNVIPVDWTRALEVARRDALGFRYRRHTEPRLVIVRGDMVENCGEMRGRLRAQTLLACNARRAWRVPLKLLAS